MTLTKQLALDTFRHRLLPPSIEQLAAFAEANPLEGLSPAELIAYLGQAIDSARTRDAAERKISAEKVEKRARAREALRSGLSTFKDARAIVPARRALWEAIEAAREAFRFAFVAERKKLTRGNQAALQSEAVVTLDQACGLNRQTNSLEWNQRLGPSPVYQQFRLAADEIEERFAVLERYAQPQNPDQPQ
jgi:hypothetical protein